MRNASPIDDFSIRERAYALWEQEGCPDGCAERHWQQAEQELSQADLSGDANSNSGTKMQGSTPSDGPGRKPRRRSAAAN